VALQYLHLNKIIHRDLKPENLVLDDKGTPRSHVGYIYLTDLGIAKHLKPDNFADTSGTPGYMAPEVMCRQNHSYEVDYYALGIILYELMMGRRPYPGKTRK
jgi:serine/threonine protein kinase